MRLCRRIACLLVLLCPLAVPILNAQAPAPTRSAAPNDQQRKGEALFLKNCALCHIHTAQKERLKIQASSELVGLFKNPSTNEARVRQLLRQGLPGLMPAQYALEPQDHDDLIAYLKTR